MSSVPIGITGAVIAALAGGWYVYGVVRGGTRPHPTTWGVWALIGALGAGSAVESGAGPGAYAAVVFLALHTVVFGLSLSRRFGKPGGEWYDYPLGLVAASALVAWQALELSAAFAAAAAVAVDALALWPTLRESWRQPHTESLAAWLADGAAAFLGALAVADWRFAPLAYPVYLAIGNGAVAGVLLIRGSRPWR